METALPARPSPDEGCGRSARRRTERPCKRASLNEFAQLTRAHADRERAVEDGKGSTRCRRSSNCQLLQASSPGAVCDAVR
eukprot:166770-Alexandrium_andersonii.AAC.1